jgi:FdhE protein
VRIKCTLCGSTKGITYHGIDGDPGAIKTETCDACHRYVKILHQQKDPAIEPLADDVASLGLDLLMRGTVFSRGGVNPFLLGY